MAISNIINGEAGSDVRTSLNQAIDFINSLGTPTTVGVNLLTLTNPGAITFLRANADNSVSALSASDFKTALSLNNVENVALSTWAGSTALTTLGTIATGVWNGTAIAVANGGTGATDASTARSNLGLAIGSNVQAYNATLAAVAGGTYTGASSITTLGTIATGVWNGTAIAVANGGTGANDAATARTNLGLAIGTNVQAYNATLSAVAGGTYTGATSITTLGTIAAGVWNGTAIAVANGGTGATDSATARTNLGLGSISTQASNSVSITGGTITGLTNLGVSMANNTAIIGIALGTITDTTSRPLGITQTWNNAGLTGIALDVNITRTASASGSLIARFRDGATDLASVHKNGYLQVNPQASPYPMLQISDGGSRVIGTGSGSTIYVGSGGVTINTSSGNINVPGRIAFQSAFSSTEGNVTQTIQSGTTSPEASVTANPGSLYQRNNSGTGEIWYKSTGTSNTGWVKIV